jgi:hypothetical protein
MSKAPSHTGKAPDPDRCWWMGRFVYARLSPSTLCFIDSGDLRGKEEKEDETAAHFPLFLTPSRILKESVSLQQ